VVTADPYPAAAADAASSGSFGSDLSGASLGQLMSEITADFSTLMRQEVELAKAEVKAEAIKAGKGAGMLGGAAYGGHMVAIFGTLTLVFAIGSQIGRGWAALIMTAVWAIVAGVLAVRGRDQLRRVHPKPEQTVQTLKEDAQWARHPTS
jgi:hypothetical protein